MIACRLDHHSSDTRKTSAPRGLGPFTKPSNRRTVAQSADLHRLGHFDNSLRLARLESFIKPMRQKLRDHYADDVSNSSGMQELSAFKLAVAERTAGYRWVRFPLPGPQV